VKRKKEGREEWTERGREEGNNTPPQRCLHSISKIFEYVTLYGKRDFEDIKVQILK
jgi:hypothetical protein